MEEVEYAEEDGKMREMEGQGKWRARCLAREGERGREPEGVNKGVHDG